jgi:hypothetical protein
MGGATSLLEREPSSVRARVLPSQTTGLPRNAFMIALPTPRHDPWERVFEELRSLALLQDDWDGLGAKAPSPALLASAVKIAEWYRASNTIAPSRVVAGTDGAIIIEWQAEGFYADLEIIKPYYAKGMVRMKGRQTQHWTLLPSDFDRMSGDALPR